MAISTVSTPIAVLIEVLIVVLGVYAGYTRKRVSGYFFAVTFLLLPFLMLQTAWGIPKTPYR